jgi:hypothetical protein
MNKKEIDGKLFGYHICPRFGKVYAEIYYTELNSNIEIQVLDNEFGSNWRWRKPVEKDYVEAEMWCRKQLKWIKDANI